MSVGQELIIGVVAGLIVSAVLVLASCIMAYVVRRKKAAPFVGTFEMLNAKTRKPYGGKVIIQAIAFPGFTERTALLNVIAEHSSGTEDWTAVIEVLGFSRIATGFFAYRNAREGGGLRLVATEGGDEIIEHGTPHEGSPFTNLLKLVKPSRQKS
jgi:hypothetical protein